VEGIGKSLITVGLVLVLLGGLLWWTGSRTGFPGAPLPGDLVIRRGNSTLYLPWVSCLLLSLLLSLLVRLLNR
jgi:Protein of unknown function (DUF2905)